MQVDLVSIQQNINLDSGLMENFILVKLPNERVLRLPISDGDLVAVIGVKREESAPVEGEPNHANATPTNYGSQEAAEATGEEASEVAVFGGAAQEAPVQQSVQVQQPAPVQQPQQPRRTRQVQMNEWGYPRVSPAPGTVDAGEIVGGGDNVDEDGVASIP